MAIVLNTVRDIDALVTLATIDRPSLDIYDIVHMRLSKVYYRLGIECKKVIADIEMCYVTRKLDYVECMEKIGDIARMIRREITKLMRDVRILDAFKYMRRMVV